MPLSVIKPMIRNPACFGLVLLLLPLLSAAFAFYGQEPVLPAAAALLLAGTAAVLGGAGLFQAARAGAFLPLDLMTYAAALFSAIGAGLAGWLTGQLEIAEPLALTAACLVTLRALCRTATSTETVSARISLDLHDPLSWEYLQVLTGAVLALIAGLAWGLVSDPASGISAGAAVLAVAWPYTPELLRRMAAKAAETRAAGYGIELYGPDALQNVQSVRAIAFDRHALLATEELVVTDVHAFDRRQEPLLAVAAAAERHATHPAARAIRSIAADWQVPEGAPEEFEEVPGLGVVAMLGGEAIAVGNRNLMQELKIDSFTATSLCRSHEAEGKTCLIVAAGGRAVGMLALHVTMHPDSPATIAAIRHTGRSTTLVSGAVETSANAFAKQLGMSAAIADKRPQTRLASAGGIAASEPGLFVTPEPGNGLVVYFLGGSVAPGALLARIHPALAASPLRHFPFLLDAAQDSGKLSRTLLMTQASLSGLAALVCCFLVLPVAASPFVCGICAAGGKALAGNWLRKNRNA
ncbi:HAD family hydrolase [Roseibium litorale]|uniref:HAD family hydrolase n=1 Tax=Roseibium litorale TaxID=2803841 RepID=A0ABR9CKT5_9HYPH|nr:HAD family hydrolase [Roseibium litorale]MBD8891454.1 HAD family hydrolase [Roseibium litorale]